MASIGFGDSLLLGLFREFYNEVIHLKRSARMEAPVPVAASDTVDDAPSPNSPQGIWQRLSGLLEQQERQASRMSGDYMFEFYKDAQFVMAALADEIFLHLDWSGKDFWEDNLLETRLFNCHSAGDTFFEKIDRLLQTQDNVYSDLAKVYLMALALGFQGRYRGKSPEPLETYRIQLFRFIKQREPHLETDAYRLFRDAYGQTLDQGKEKRLPHPRGWILGLILLLLGLFALSHALWLNNTLELKEILRQILTIK